MFFKKIFARICAGALSGTLVFCIKPSDMGVQKTQVNVHIDEYIFFDKGDKTFNAKQLSTGFKGLLVLTAMMNVIAVFVSFGIEREHLRKDYTNDKLVTEKHRELVNAVMGNDDNISIISLTDEYDDLVKRLGGVGPQKIDENEL